MAGDRPCKLKIQSFKTLSELNLVTPFKKRLNVPTYVLKHLLRKNHPFSSPEVIEQGLEEAKRI